MDSSRQNRKKLTGLLIFLAAAALTAVYVLYGKSRDERPNEPPAPAAQSSMLEPAAAEPWVPRSDSPRET